MLVLAAGLPDAYLHGAPPQAQANRAFTGGGLRWAEKLRLPTKGCGQAEVTLVMLFRRRERPGLLERLRVSLWPRRSWARSSRYVMFRVSRLRASPHTIAVGFAAGVLASFTPLMGFHFLLGGILAWAARGSIIASAFGTFLGNPLTFPFIWFATYELGSWILGRQSARVAIDLSHNIWDSSIATLSPLIVPMLVGGIPLGLVAAAVGYFLVKRLVEAYQEKRRRDAAAPSHDKRAASA